LGARGVGLAGALEGGRGFLPLLEIAVANAQVETRRAVLRVDVGECRVGFRGGLVIAHLILDVAECRIERRISFAVFDRLEKEPAGAFQLALQVQGHGFGERLAGALLASVGDRRHARRHGHAVRVGYACVFHGSLLQVLKNRVLRVARRYGSAIHTPATAISFPSPGNRGAGAPSGNPGPRNAAVFPSAAPLASMAQTWPSQSSLRDTFIQKSRARSPASRKKPTPPATRVLSMKESTSSPSIEVTTRVPRTSTANCMGRLLCTMMLRGVWVLCPDLPSTTLECTRATNGRMPASTTESFIAW